MSNIDSIREDYNIGDPIRIVCSLGIKEGFIESISENRIKKTDLVNVFKCNNPRCICSTEQELPHIFRQVAPEIQKFRCIYCESKAK